MISNYIYVYEIVFKENWWTLVSFWSDELEMIGWLEKGFKKKIYDYKQNVFIINVFYNFKPCLLYLFSFVILNSSPTLCFNIIS